jgi:shikimate kinase
LREFGLSLSSRSKVSEIVSDGGGIYLLKEFLRGGKPRGGCQYPRRWWVKEFEELSNTHRKEVQAETSAAFKLAEKRGERYKEKTQ